MLGDLLIGLFSGVLGGSLSEKISARKTRRLQEEHRVECSLRVLEGHHVGLAEKWRHGIADLSAGAIDLGWALVEVSSVDQSSVPDPTAREAWSVSPRCKLVQVKSPGANLEWALPEEQFEWSHPRLWAARPNTVNQRADQARIKGS